MASVAAVTGPVGAGFPGPGDPATGPSTPRSAWTALGAVLTVSAVLTGWRAGSDLELYYAAGVRSMASDWHDAFFAAFDPRATVSLDKLPGAFWIQALSVRAFGVHPWALAAPQVLEGLASVVVLFLLVRRLAGPWAGVVAAGLLAAAPASTALDRGNISDSLLVLCLLVAARLTVALVDHPSSARAAWVGLVVGVAFQAKMVEAWLLLPVLGLVVLVCAPAPPTRRLLHLGTLVAVAVAVSLSWMVAVSAVPTAQRPYVDGSRNDSLFEQVFDYNGLGRVGRPSPNQLLGRTLGLPFLDDSGPAAGPLRLVSGPYGRAAGWLLPGAFLSALACGLWCRRRSRGDPLVVATLLFGSWLVLFSVVFSASAAFNAYYLAVLDPAVAGLVAVALRTAWATRDRASSAWFAAGLVTVTAATALHLLPRSGSGTAAALVPVVVVLGAGALAAIGTTRPGRPADAVAPTAAALVVGSVVLVPLVASVWITAGALGPFDTPFQPAATTAFTRAFFSPTANVVGLAKISAARGGAADLFAAQTSALAAPYIFATGQEVLPIGGYTGTVPYPTLAALRRDVASGAFHLVLAGPTTHDPRIAWIARNCQDLGTPSGGGAVAGAAAVRAYFCLPADARG